jgi:hypothetical protein
LDFMGFSFRTSKSKIDINYIKYQFSHRFGKVCRWLNIYYSHINNITNFFKVTTMSIWIIFKNLVWTHRECILSCFWAIVPCIHPWDAFSNKESKHIEVHSNYAVQYK